MLSSSPSPVLTTEQAAIFDSALRERAASCEGGGGGGAASGGGVVTGATLSVPAGPALGGGGAERAADEGGRSKGKRRTGNGNGRDAWGDALDDESVGAVAAIDRNDPNYDSGDEPYRLVSGPVSDTLAWYKSRVRAVTAELFRSGDVREAWDSFQELDLPYYAHFFVKVLVAASLDRREREKELAATLLGALCGEGVSVEQAERGIGRLLDGLDDLVLDVPSAPADLATFAARACLDGLVRYDTVEAWAAGGRECAGAGARAHECAAAAARRLSNESGAAEVYAAWGGGGEPPLERAKRQIDEMLGEYLDTRDAAEAGRCLHAMGMPFFGHEVVKRALYAAIEKKNADAPVLDLLEAFAASGQITKTQFVKGFRRVHERLPDLALDCPGAPAHLDSLVAGAKERGALPASFAFGGSKGAQSVQEAAKTPASAPAPTPGPAPQAAPQSSPGADPSMAASGGQPSAKAPGARSGGGGGGKRCALS